MFPTRRFIASSRAAAAAGLLSVFAFAASAHDFDPHNPPIGPNGGMLTAGDAGHVEFGLEDGSLTVWLTDHGDQPIPTQGLTAHAAIINGTERVSVVLEPAEGHMMRVEDPRIAPAVGARVSFDTVLEDGIPMEARVTIPDEDAVREEYVPHDHDHDHGHDHAAHEH